MKDQHEKKKSAYLLMIVVLAVILGVFIGTLISNMIKKKQMQDHYEELANKNNTAKQESETVLSEEKTDILTQLGITIPEKSIDWEALQKENQDIYAWIYIPGTNIDYPIVQHQTDNEYYVNHNLDGSEGRPAAIMTQNYNTKTFLDANTIVYGHNMKNGTMFGKLHDFEDEEFFNQNTYIYIYLPDQVYVYEVFAEYIWGNELIPVSYDFSSDAGYQEYLDKILAYRGKDGLYREGVTLTTKNHLLTLSTCTNPTDYDYRYLVQGVLINDPTLTDAEIMTTLKSIS